MKFFSVSLYQVNRKKKKKIIIQDEKKYGNRLTVFYLIEVLD